MAKKNSRRPYQFIVVLDARDRSALELVAENERLTRSDTIRRLIRAAARRLERKDSTAAA
jgi:hypothetical protein